MQTFWLFRKDDILDVQVKETDDFVRKRDLSFDWMMLEFTSEKMQL